MPIPAVGDSLCRHDESTTTSAREPSVLLVASDEMLLSLGKGKDRLCR